MTLRQQRKEFEKWFLDPEVMWDYEDMRQRYEKLKPIIEHLDRRKKHASSRYNPSQIRQYPPAR